MDNSVNQQPGNRKQDISHILIVTLINVSRCYRRHTESVPQNVLEF
jgi:hypothetical protein